jgi:hypothetical protein
MNVILDLSAIALSGSVLAYQLTVGAADRRLLREVAGVPPENDFLTDLRAVIAQRLAPQPVSPYAPTAEAAVKELIKDCEPAPVVISSGPAPVATGSEPAPSDSGDSLTPAQKAMAMRKELEALNVNDIRSSIRELPENKRVAIRANVGNISNARKADLIEAFLASFLKELNAK